MKQLAFVLVVFLFVASLGRTATTVFAGTLGGEPPDLTAGTPGVYVINAAGASTITGTIGPSSPPADLTSDHTTTAMPWITERSAEISWDRLHQLAQQSAGNG